VYIKAMEVRTMCCIAKKIRLNSVLFISAFWFSSDNRQSSSCYWQFAVGSNSLTILTII